MRLPLTAGQEMSRLLCGLGSELVGLHLMESDAPPVAGYPIEGDNRMEKVAYSDPHQGAPEGRVWINKTQYFAGVPAEVWDFYIGGYRACEKWLKDRKGRTLTYDDRKHYQQVAAALAETIRLMEEIDRVIEAHGGWPLAGSQIKSQSL
ncbi:MAG: hypothetical protein IT210_04370 [Armatimonadetes bacterium]|nr:hypothetical protein [Armatimonadota bacterium]